MALLSISYGGNTELAARFRNAVGLPDDAVLLPEDSIVEAMKAAWNQFRRDFAVRAFGSFETNADTQAYSILPSNAIRVRRVWWPIPAECETQSNQTLRELDRYLTDPINELGTRVLRDPSLIGIMHRHLSWLKRFSPGGAELLNKSTVYLDPVPTTVKTVWFEYLDQPAVSYLSLEEEDAEPFFDLVEAKLHERLSTGAGAITGIRDLEEGTWVSTEAAKRHAEMAVRKKVAYDAAVPPPIPTF